jgi:hypothetical protein
MPYQVSAVRVEFTTIVTFLDIDKGLLNEADDLDVIGSLHELDACQRARGNQTSSMAGLCAPCDFLAFRVSDSGVRVNGCPKAEI